MVVGVIEGNGFIGHRVVRLLAAKGPEEVSLDFDALDAFVDLGKQVRSARLDLSNFEEVVAALAAYEPVVVINLRYLHNTRLHTDSQVNVLGTDNSFEAACLCNVERVVYARFFAVNGYQSSYGEKLIHEGDLPALINQYGVHKVFNESQARGYSASLT